MRKFMYTTRQAVLSVWKKLSRESLRVLMVFYPEERKLAAERWLRGKYEYGKLQQTDWVFVSFGKSGRTWLRVMLSRVYQQLYGLPQHALLGFDNFHGMNRAIPRVFFTHDNYIKNYTGHYDSKVDFYAKHVVLLVRDPRDVVVSQFFQWQHRMTAVKSRVLEYPDIDASVSVYDFAMAPTGLERTIAFMNLWASEIDKIRGVFLLRYEDMRNAPETALKGLVDFMRAQASDTQIREAVEFASYENMKKMEQKQAFRLSGGRMKPTDRSNPDTYKVRRGKVGGYRDYFDDEQMAVIDKLVGDTLSPYYGYTAEQG